MLLFVSCAYAGSVSWGQRLSLDVLCNRVGELAVCVKRSRRQPDLSKAAACKKVRFLQLYWEGWSHVVSIFDFQVISDQGIVVHSPLPMVKIVVKPEALLSQC